MRSFVRCCYYTVSIKKEVTLYEQKKDYES